MNIGFDAKRFFQNSTGLGNYSRQLISGLSAYNPNHNFVLFAPTYNQQYKNFINETNNTVITPTTFPYTYLKSMWRSKAVVKDIQKNKIDVFHGLSHELPFGIHKAGVKTVVTMHDLIFERYPEQYKKIDRLLYRKKAQYAVEHADIIIAASQQTKNDLIDFYQVDEEKIKVGYQTYNPVFTNTISESEKDLVRKQYHLPANFFLYVGSIIERKNLLSILKSLQQLQGKLSIPLVVVGHGKQYKQEVKAYIEKHHLEDTVIFLADRTPQDNQSSTDILAALYQLATALIYPSIFEGFGIPVLEAMISGTPVITTPISSMPEVADKAALYVKPFDIEQMAQSMYNIATDESLRSTLIEQGYQQAKHFSPEATTEVVMKIYKSLVHA